MNCGDVSLVKLEPVIPSWGNPQTDRVKAIADVAGSLGGKYFNLVAQDGGLFYVWLDGGGDVDPAPAGRTAIAVSYTDNDSATVIAGLIKTAIDANINFNAAVDPCALDEVIVQVVGMGAGTPVADVDTGFTMTELLVGSLLGIGLTDGDIEVSFSQDLFDIVAQQEGTTILDKIRQGINLDPIAISMKESDAAKLKEITLGSGDNFVPPGGTEMFGMGTSKQFTNSSADARYLNFHPRRLATNDLSEDMTFFRTNANLTGLNYSGESDQMIQVEFDIFPNPLINTKISVWGKGNYTQNVLVV